MTLPTITLTSIVCNHPSEDVDGDEVYVIYQADAGVPYRIPGRRDGIHQMQAHQSWTINQAMTFSRDLLITLYDQDFKYMPSWADYLCSWDYTPDALPPSVTLSNADGANYTINITVNG